jgi:uncharacterized protein YcnI
MTSSCSASDCPMTHRAQWFGPRSPRSASRGVHRWIEVPDEGQDPDSVEEPAPFVTLTEKAE